MLDFQLDPTNTPIVVLSAKGQILFPNLLAYLGATSPGLRPGLTQEIVQLDAQDDQVFVKVRNLQPPNPRPAQEARALLGPPPSSS